MLSEKEFDEWYKSLNLLERARAEIEHIRFSPPARRVQSRVGNVTGHFNRSRKMGFSIQSESRTVEKPAILIMEVCDDDVLEFWDQPPSFVINYKSKGRNLGHYYTADFFVIRRDTAGWEEWKTQEQLLNLAEKNPEKYHMGEDGKWHCPPAERYAQQFGLYHRVRSSAEISWLLIRNLNLLMPFHVSYSQQPEIAHDPLCEKISALVNNEPGITLADLVRQTEGATNGDIFKLIAFGKIYVDLEAAFLGEPEKVHVFRSKAVATLCRRMSERVSENRESKVRACDLIPGSTLTWENKTFKVLNTSRTKLSLRDPTGVTEHYRNEDIERFISEGLIIGCQTILRTDPTAAQLELEAKRSATDDEIIAALDHERIVLQMLKGEKIASNDNKARKYRNWRARYQKEGLAGLIFHRKGNRIPRLDPRVSDLIKAHLKGIEKPGRGALSLAYGALRNECEAKGYRPCSAKTFRLAFNARQGPEQTEKMEGSRAAYQEEEPISSDYYTIPVNGDRPWQYAHIDHTVVDLELRHSEKPRKKMGKVWITLMIDAYSRRILAFYFSFESPSKISVMMVLRECVSRHNRLPECIVVDNGKEFRSTYFEKLLSRKNCDIQWRPPSQPRYGAIMERFIKTMNIQFVHELEGNTKIMAMKLRLVTRAVNPKNLAVWNLPLLEEEAEKYFYEEYDSREHGTLGQSPKEAYEDATERYNVPYAQIEYDENFIIDVLPSTAKGTAKVVRGRGVKIEYVFYNNSRVFKAAGVYGKQVEVRFDPWNRALAYAYIKGRWETLQAPPDLFYKLQNRSYRELRALSHELRRTKSLYGKNFNARVMEMAEKRAPREVLENIEKQRQRDEEKRGAARRTGRHLSVEDFRGKPVHKEPPPSGEPEERVTTNASNKADMRSFGNLKRRTA